MDCINLKQRFGRQFRVAYEEGYYVEHGDHARAEDPWLQVLLCKHGHIYPQGGDMLAASSDKRGPLAKALVGLDCTTVLQDGDDGVNVTFHVDHFDKIATLLQPRRRRRVSEQERQRLAELGRANLERYRQANVEAPETGPASPQSTSHDSETA